LNKNKNKKKKKKKRKKRKKKMFARQLAGGLLVKMLPYTGPERPRATFEPQTPRFRLTWGGHGAQGLRPTMEDEHAVDVRGDDSVAFFAVYDGHAGARCSEHLSQTVHHSFFDLLPRKGAVTFREIARALRGAFDAAEQSWLDLAIAPDGATVRAEDGSCAIAVALDLHGGTATAANTGDSRAVLQRARTDGR
jgi:serine/threonine protein phosphatase PrpC